MNILGNAIVVHELSYSYCTQCENKSVSHHVTTREGDCNEASLYADLQMPMGLTCCLPKHNNARVGSHPSRLLSYLARGMSQVPLSAACLTIQVLAACFTKGKRCNEAFALVYLLLLMLPRAGPEAEPFPSLTILLQDFVNLLSTEAIIHPSFTPCWHYLIYSLLHVSADQQNCSAPAAHPPCSCHKEQL